MLGKKTPIGELFDWRVSEKGHVANRRTIRRLIAR
jgi:hypothetical protein